MSLAFPAAPTVGQVYQGWTWNGSAWDPNFATKFVTSINGRQGALTSGQIGAREFIATQTVSTPVVSVQFFNDISAMGFDLIEVDCVLFGTDGNGWAAVNFSADGLAFDVGSGNYGYVLAQIVGDTVTTTVPSASGWQVGFGYFMGTLNASQQSYGTLRIHAPQSNGLRKMFGCRGTNGMNFVGWPVSYITSSVWLTTNPIKALRFGMSAGNFGVGSKFTLYGVNKP